MRQTLRQDGDTFVIEIPSAFIELHGLSNGSQLELRLLGSRMTIEVPSRPRAQLAALMAEMPEGFPRADGWEDMPPVGRETC